MSSSEKKEGAGTKVKQQNFFVSKYDIFSMKRVTRKFHVLVMQNNDKELCTKSVLHVQSLFFLLIRPIVCLFVFLPFSLSSLFSIT